ncbi:hypothetical protein CVT25_003842 [Psilocybe cyanescens]|uniref:Copper-fist domain-containing protein n=1 Tax=Psilocybe cyanescens TaxID=93625 RepID=A0A409WY08_PSICY|nr:hypothetical protein CVT25_003842 [Psilocybe cyanescens]
MIISSKKYACETCIKGHRSSACKHTDRPLFEIKKKGRPVTQCEHCRELRKTKQVHVKCICEAKEESSYQQGPKPGFESATFPNGLPQALEASVAFQSLAEGTSSDSDHGGVRQGHKCKSGDPCNCVTPRIKSRARDGLIEQRDFAASGPSRDHSGRSPTQNPSRTSAQILARIAELRPVLPRPTQDSYPFGGPVHDPSVGLPHAHSSRHHDNKPYKHAAYGMTHQHVVQPSSYPSLGLSNPAYPYNAQTYSEQMQMMEATPAWAPRDENLGFGDPFPSLCGCGDGCSCPGCLHHNRSTSIPSSSAYSSCRNPETCATCLDCTIMSLPPSAILPADTALSIYDSGVAIDDWLRQMSAPYSSDISSPTQYQQTFPMQGSPFQQPPPPGWNNRGGFPYADQQTNMNGMPPANHNYGPSSVQPMMPFGSSSSSRSPVYPNQPSRGHRPQGSNVDESVIDPRLLPPANHPESQFLRVPRSRSPSTSSQSSQQGSDGQGGGGPIPPYRPSGRMQGMYHPNAQGGRSAPQLNIRPAVQRGPSSGSSSSVSPSPGSGGNSNGRLLYGSNSPSTASSEYDPSLAGLQIY